MMRLIAVLRRLVVFFCARSRQRHAHGSGRLAALARVRLVDDDGEAPAAVLVADLVEDERELLDRRDDDLLAALDELAQVARVLGVADRRAHLRELLDRVADLLVEDAPVGDDDDRVEDRRCRPCAGR